MTGRAFRRRPPVTRRMPDGEKPAAARRYRSPSRRSVNRQSSAGTDASRQRERVPGKNFRMLGDRPLYQHIVGRRCCAVPRSTRWSSTPSSETIIEQAAGAFPGVRILRRPEHLPGRRGSR